MTARRLALRIVPVLSAILLGAAISACGSGGDRDYEEGYREGYVEGHADGVVRGERRGAREGVSAGTSSPGAEAWRDIRAHPCFAPAFWSFLVGVGMGLVCQYIVLLDAGDNGRVPSLVQTGLVPGMTSTFSYRLLERRWRLMAALDEWLERAACRRNARIQEFRAVRALVAARIQATSDLEELVLRKYVALASRELDRIVSEAESERREPPASD